MSAPVNPTPHHFLPRRLFTNILQSGFQELSVHFLLTELDMPSVSSISWRIESAGRDFSIVVDDYPLSPSEMDQGAVLITATLPPRWKNGQIKVRLPAEGGHVVFSQAIESYQQADELFLPLAGQALTVAGHRLGELHRSAFQIPSQQFGWDLLGLSDDHFAILNSSPTIALKAVDFATFGMAVLAPAAGQIIDLGDDAPDLGEIGQLPSDLSTYQSEPIRALGNYLVIRHETGTCALLAHLRFGSLLVNAGQQVVAGQELAAVGNSGFSSGPHLHFHLMDGPNVLTASPLPVALTLEEGTFAPESGNIVANG